MSKTKDMTQGDIIPLILAFYFPMLSTNMLQQIYTIADTVIVGKGLGDDPVAAVGNMSSVTFLIFGFAIGLSNGFSVVIAQAFGAKNSERLRRSVASAIRLAVVIAAVLTPLSLIFLPDILRIMQTDQSVISDSLKYGRIVFGGLAATLAYNLCAGILRALGDSKTPLFAIITSSVVNICLDYTLIFICRMGVEGAAIATVFSQIVSTMICLLRLRKISEIRVTREDFVACRSLHGELLRNGIPMALMNSITAIGCVVVQYFVNGIGVAYMSAYSACSKYINLFIQPACTAGYTMSAYTSQNYGAKQYDRIRSGLFVCLAIAFVAYILLGSLMVLIPKQLAGLILNEPERIALVTEYFPICGAALIGVDFLFVFRSGVQGMGRPMIPMISGIIEMVMRILIIVLLIDRVGFRATAFAEIGAWFGALALNVTAFCYFLHLCYRKKNHFKQERIISHG